MQTWDRLYRNTYPIVYNYVKRIHAGWHISYDQINDVTNEAFKRCFINLDTFLGNSKFSTWVCGFCRYILLSYYHKFRMQNKYVHNIYGKTQSYHERENPEIYVIICHPKRAQSMFMVRFQLSVSPASIIAANLYS